MKKYTLILLFLSGSISLFSQNISKELFDKLFNDFIKYKNIGITDNSVIKQEPVKCGFVIANFVRMHCNSFTYEQQQVLKPLLTRPVLQASTVSPSGFFRIHYDTIGINTPAYSTIADTLH